MCNDKKEYLVPFSNEPSRAIGRLVLSEKRRPEYTMHELSRVPRELDLVNIMTSCWVHESKKRPSMREIRLKTDIICIVKLNLEGIK